MRVRRLRLRAPAQEQRTDHAGHQREHGTDEESRLVAAVERDRRAGAAEGFGTRGSQARQYRQPEAIAVVLAIDVFVALWAPADLIIEDSIGPTTLDLVELTSVNFPLPLTSEHITSQGIRVKVTPLDKIPQQYRERREYISDDEDSRYEIVLRYNRLV